MRKRTKQARRTSKIAMLAMTIMMLVGATLCVNADSKTVTVGKDKVTYSMPSSITIEQGKTKTIAVDTSDERGRYTCNVSWQCTSKYLDMSGTECGTYWGKKAQGNFTGKATGKSDVIAGIRVFNKSKKLVGEVSLLCEVNVAKDSTVTKPSTPSTPAKKPDKKPAKESGKYVNASKAYTCTNKFRTSKKVWQWNKGNKKKTYFNTKKSNTLKPLKKSAKLEKIAKTRAKEISKKFSHTRPNGKSWSSLHPKNRYCSENIAMNHDDDGSLAVEMWKESKEKYGNQGHRRAMLNKKFNSIGIACYEVNGTQYWVQCFAEL